jgi:hypothetical protein
LRPLTSGQSSLQILPVTVVGSVKLAALDDAITAAVR